MLALDLPSGGRLRTTWTAPQGEPRGWAWVQHGFMRHAADLAGLAGLLAGAGFGVVRPDIATLRPVRSLHDARWLTEGALTVARAVEMGIPQARGIEAAGPWAVLGHSAGAAVAVHVAGCFEAGPGLEPVASLVLLDPVDTVGGILGSALPGVRRPGIVHACRPSRCNRQGATVRALDRQGWPVVHHPGLAHPDPERIPPDALPGSVPAPAPWLARVCGAPGTPDAVAALAREVRGEVVNPRGM